MLVVIRWITKLPFFITAGFVTLCGFVYQLPPHHHYFILERKLLAAAQIALGVVSIPIGFVSVLPTLCSLASIILLGCGLGLVVQLFSALGNLSRLLLLIGLILNSLFGMFVATISGTYVEPAYTACESYTADGQGISIVVYTEYAWPQGEHFFILATRDNGATWQQVLYHRRDDPRFDNHTLCENFRSQDAEFHCVWIDSQAAISEDGGETWRAMSTYDLPVFSGKSHP
jgi:hypothetical protein